MDGTSPCAQAADAQNQRHAGAPFLASPHHLVVGSHIHRTPNAVKNFFYRRGDAPTRAKRKSIAHDAAADAGQSKRRQPQDSGWSVHDRDSSTTEGPLSAPLDDLHRPSMLSGSMLAAVQGHIETPLSTHFISASQNAVYHSRWTGGPESAESGSTRGAPSAWPTVESQRLNASASYPTFHPAPHVSQQDMQRAMHFNPGGLGASGLAQPGQPQAFAAHRTQFSIPIQNNSDSSLSRQGASPRFALHGVTMSPHGSAGATSGQTSPPAHFPSDPRYHQYAAAAPGGWPQSGSVTYAMPGRTHGQAQAALAAQSWQAALPPGPIAHGGMPPPGWQATQPYDTSLPRAHPVPHGSYSITFAAPPTSLSSAAYTSDGYHVRAQAAGVALPPAAAAMYPREQAVDPTVGFPTNSYGRGISTPRVSAGHGEQQPYTLHPSPANAFDHTYGKPQEGMGAGMQYQLQASAHTGAQYVPLSHNQYSHGLGQQELTGDMLQYRPQWSHHSALAVPVSAAAWPPPQPGQYLSAVADRPQQGEGGGGRGALEHGSGAEFVSSFAPKHGEPRLDDDSLSLTPPRKQYNPVGIGPPVGTPGGFDAGEFCVGALADASNDSVSLDAHW